MEVAQYPGLSTEKHPLSQSSGTLLWRISLLAMHPDPLEKGDAGPCPLWCPWTQVMAPHSCSHREAFFHP